jgi:hypothetical protein
MAPLWLKNALDGPRLSTRAHRTEADPMPQQRVEREKIVVWPSLAEAWWIALLPLPPLGFAIWMAVRGEYVVAVIFAAAFLGLGGFAWSLLSRRSTSLELRRDGIEMRIMGKRARRFLWTDIEGFARAGGPGGASVGWLLRAGSDGRRSETGRRLSGADVALPAYLCGDPAKIEALLGAARAAALGGTWPAFLDAQRAERSARR